MLQSIYIENFAIIDKVSVEFTDKLNIISGETGSGKSIILEAFQLLLGQRFNKNFIRDPQKKTIVEASFLIDDEKVNYLSDMGYDIEDGTLLISRVVDSKQRSTNKLNGRPVTLSQLKDIMENFVDIHGQNENQSLLNKENYINIIDAFDKENLDKLKVKLDDIIREIDDLSEKLKKYDMSDEEKDREMDLIDYQLVEISGLDIDNIDEEEVEARYKKISNNQMIMDNLDLIIMNYSSQDYDQSDLNSHYNIILSKIEEISDYDKDLDTFRDLLNKNYYELQEIIDQISSYKSGLYEDEEEVYNVEKLINDITMLKRKYGPSLRDVISFRDELLIRQEELNKITEYREKIEKEIADLNSNGFKISEEIHEIRVKISTDLEKKISDNLLDLGMKNAEFKISISVREDFNKSGFDDIDFLIRTNLGQDLKSLKSIASGGEISRIMLGFKSVLSEVENPDTLIFDEIDSGISGRTAVIVGQKLVDISNKAQIIAISHLPQIAGLSDNHILIEKTDIDGQTKSVLRVLDYKEKIGEIARLIGGTDITDTTYEQAELIVKQADQLKMDRR
ncbi:MAG: DNA repair protein RecN [Finegoldia sp.]|nr:DNA repair protein RecN [Finegoldia sp.]